MSGVSSNTGLLTARIQPIYKVKPKKIELLGIAKPAPFILRPFAGIFNPYPYGCSIFCNHPADCEAKEYVKRAKELWANEGKALLLPNEMEMIRKTLLASGIVDSSGINDGIGGVYDIINPMTNVPDELFRKYTETDSRPLTPTPTLASGPVSLYRNDNIDMNITCNPRERTTLILDLRTASQEQDIETLNWHAVILEPPPSPMRKNSQISKYYPPIATTNREQHHHHHNHNYYHRHHQQLQQTDPICQEVIDENISKDEDNRENNENINDDILIIKRRGKRLKKRKRRRGSTYGQQCEVRDPLEPLETQVSQINNGSRKNSALTTLDNVNTIKIPDEESIGSIQHQSTASSFISPEILKHIIRNLDNETIEQEFFLRKNIVMIEALRVKNELQLRDRSLNEHSVIEFPLAINSPRIFSRQNARFELLDSASLITMKPLDYLGKHVFLTTGRKLIFARTFNKYYYQDMIDNSRYISSNDIIKALNEIMGKQLNDEQIIKFDKLIGEIAVALNFRTWCGVCAACERLLSSLPPRNLDMPTWIEIADFQALERRLRHIKVDEKLNNLLIEIRDR